MEVLLKTTKNQAMEHEASTCAKNIRTWTLSSRRLKDEIHVNNVQRWEVEQNKGID
jgi:hypothetical protein